MMTSSCCPPRLALERELRELDKTRCVSSLLSLAAGRHHIFSPHCRELPPFPALSRSHCTDCYHNAPRTCLPNLRSLRLVCPWFKCNQQLLMDHRLQHAGRCQQGLPDEGRIHSGSGHEDVSVSLRHTMSKVVPVAHKQQMPQDPQTQREASCKLQSIGSDPY